MENNTHIWFTYPILIDRCICGKQIGVHQKSLEEEINKEISENVPLAKARSKVLKNRGFTRTCCLSFLANPTRFLINDAVGYSYIDTTKKTESGYENTRGKDNKVGFPFIFKTKDIEEFDQEKYGEKVLRSNIHDDETYNEFRIKRNGNPKFTSLVKRT